MVYVVPGKDASIVVPRAAREGKPLIKKAGREIKPPPPAIASTKPARNTKGHEIKKVYKSMFMVNKKCNNSIKM